MQPNLPSHSGGAQVELCQPQDFVSDYVDCEKCPDGAICNGSEVLAAQKNYWRTGYYDDNGTYYPNTNEERFIRCPNAACLGGVDSECKTGTGPYCGDCEDKYVFNLFLLRCEECTLGIGHLFAWFGWLVSPSATLCSSLATNQLQGRTSEP